MVGTMVRFKQATITEVVNHGRYFVSFLAGYYSLDC